MGAPGGDDQLDRNDRLFVVFNSKYTQAIPQRPFLVRWKLNAAETSCLRWLLTLCV